MKAFVFPGQGAQFTGMGKELYENNPKAKELFEAYCRETEEEGRHPIVLGGKLIDRSDTIARHLEIMDELARKLGLREPKK